MPGICITTGILEDLHTALGHQGIVLLTNTFHAIHEKSLPLLPQLVHVKDAVKSKGRYLKSGALQHTQQYIPDSVLFR